MSNDLVSTPWTPPESKVMQSIVKWGGLAALVIGGFIAFNTFAPTVVTAVTLLNLILQDATHMIISGVGLIIVAWLARETISPAGSINRLLRMPYWIMVNGLTRFFLNIDPLSPITERLQAVRADQAQFQKQFETLDGLISSLHDKAANYRDQSAKAQRLGIAATKQGQKAAAEVAISNFGRFKDAADSYEATAQRLDPIRKTFQNISQACDITAQKLETERTLLADKWQVQKAVGSATKAASRILGRSKTQVWDMAQQAETLIDTKYSEELGHLDHLKNYAEPFLQSIDVENASYSEEMFQQVQTGGAKLLESTAATPLPLAPPVEASTSSDMLAGFIRS
jgi:hypothetical protein